MKPLLRYAMFSFALALAGAGCSTSPEYREGKNLVPEAASETPDVWCTWRAQTRMAEAAKIAQTKAKFAGDQGGAAYGARDNMNEHVMFGENGKGGFADHYPEIRSDMFLLFDDGWDVPFKSSNADDIARFGSLILNEDRFPSFGGQPRERLKKLNDAAIERGWRGAGLWIAAQRTGEKWNSDKIPAQQQYEYWKERVLWCKYAGIKYWKVDWGAHLDDIQFRKMLTDIGRKYYPDLIIEHSMPSSPLNGLALDSKTGEPIGGGRMKDWKDKAFLSDLEKLIPLVDCIRTYDVIGHLENATTFDRIAYYLEIGKRSNSSAILNGEDALYMCATLGMSCGVMRTPLYPPNKNGKIMDDSAEVARAVRWHRIAPAFALNASEINVSGEILKDSQFFPKGSTWCTTADGKTVWQCAPAAIARGLPLPKVEAIGEKPFVAVSKHPNGAIAAGVFGRVTVRDGFRTPPADVFVDADISGAITGIFGNFKSITFNISPNIGKVLAQDLASNKSVDITHLVKIAEGKITIGGEVLRWLCPPRSPNDTSEPGVAILALKK